MTATRVTFHVVACDGHGCATVTEPWPTETEARLAFWRDYDGVTLLAGGWPHPTRAERVTLPERHYCGECWTTRYRAETGADRMGGEQ